MTEIFVIYDRTTGFIEGGAGRIDRDAESDGSTMAERIPDILKKNPNRTVIYLPDQDLPDPNIHRIDKGKIVKMTKANQEERLKGFPKSQRQLLEERVKALEDQLEKINAK